MYEENNEKQKKLNKKPIEYKEQVNKIFYCKN
jgi:hypothetical protein